MNVTRFTIIILGVLNACATVFSRALPASDEEESHSRSKRGSADQSISDKNSRQKAKNTVHIFLQSLLDRIDTSGFDHETGTFSIETTTTNTNGIETASSNTGNGASDKSADSSSVQRRKSKKRGGRKRKNKKGRRRRRKNKRRKHRHRSRRDLTDAIARLLQSEDGERVIRAVASAVSMDGAVEDVRIAEDIIKNSAKKCECSLNEPVDV